MHTHAATVVKHQFLWAFPSSGMISHIPKNKTLSYTLLKPQTVHKLF